MAVILDGNRRWAVKNGLMKTAGHNHGGEALKKLLPAAINRGIPVISLYAFSTENWRRAQEELSVLISLIAKFMSESIDWADKQGVQIRFSGRLTDFSTGIQEIFKTAAEATKKNAKIIVNFCMSYGEREELPQAARRIAAAVKNDPQAIAAINDETINRHLYTAGLPDVDLLIRTGGEKRLSGFMPWQSTYAELYFTDTLWPDFNEEELDRALEDFAKRKRNFGK